MADQLREPTVANWRRLYQSGARARCIVDDPPMKGFGRSLKAGDVVDVHGVCWDGIHFELAVRSETAFYRLEGYFEVVCDDPDSWTDPRHRRGLAGEREAMEYLRARGWTVLDHRFRMGRLEVDLVARRGQLVAFVEVKTRSGAGFGTPAEAVTWSKRREIVRVARAWMDRYGHPGDVYRFDVIGILVSETGAARVQHIEDAFRPGWR